VFSVIIVTKEDVTATRLKEKRLELGKTVGRVSGRRPRTFGKRRKQLIRIVSTKSPSCSCLEIPILQTLAEAPGGCLPSSEVIRALFVANKWFDHELSDDDLAGRYPRSKRLIHEIITRFCRENLVLKQEMAPPGIRPGEWRITEKGRERLQRAEVSLWRPNYVEHCGAVILEDDPDSDGMTSEGVDQL
jgi:hypothetical protein